MMARPDYRVNGGHSDIQANHEQTAQRHLGAGFQQGGHSSLRPQDRELLEHRHSDADPEPERHLAKNNDGHDAAAANDEGAVAQVNLSDLQR
jgi:hypothetical protein